MYSSFFYARVLICVLNQLVKRPKKETGGIQETVVSEIQDEKSLVLELR